MLSKPSLDILTSRVRSYPMLMSLNRYVVQIRIVLCIQNYYA